MSYNRICSQNIFKYMFEKKFNLNNRDFQNRKWLYKHYINLNMNSQSIAEIAKVTSWEILYWLAKYEIYKFNGEKLYRDEAWLFKNYIILNKTQTQVSKKFGVTERIIRYNLKRHGIYKRDTITPLLNDLYRIVKAINSFSFKENTNKTKKSYKKYVIIKKLMEKCKIIAE